LHRGPWTPNSYDIKISYSLINNNSSLRKNTRKARLILKPQTTEESRDYNNTGQRVKEKIISLLVV